MILPLHPTSARRKIDGTWHVIDRRDSSGISAEWDRIVADRHAREAIAAKPAKTTAQEGTAPCSCCPGNEESGSSLVTTS